MYIPLPRLNKPQQNLSCPNKILAQRERNDYNKKNNTFFLMDLDQGINMFDVFQ